MIEELKKISITELDTDAVLEHRSNVLKLEKNEIIEYLEFVLDTEYKSEDEGDNDEKLDLFFEGEDFRVYYDEILTADEE